jgi:hypothetical protein
MFLDVRQINFSKTPRPTRFSWFSRGGGKQPFEIDGRNYGHYRNEPVSHQHVKRIAEHGFSLCRIHSKKIKK